MAPRDASYFQNRVLARQAANTALVNWQARGNKVAVETALATVNDLTGLGLVNAKNNLISEYDSVRNVNATTTATPFVPVGLFSSHVFSDSSSWNKFAIGASEYSSFQHNTYSNYSDGSSNWLFWSWGSSNSGWSNSSFHDIDTSQLTVSFEYMPSTVTIPQPNIAAFICQLMPKEPNPQVALLPDA